MLSRRLMLLTAVVGVSFTPAVAVETDAIDPRSTALGGGGVAVVEGSSAWYHNPAALGHCGFLGKPAPDEDDREEGDLTGEVALDAGAWSQLRGQNGSNYAGVAGGTAGVGIQVGPFATGYRVFAAAAVDVHNYPEAWVEVAEEINHWRRYEYNRLVVEAMNSGDWTAVDANPLVLLEERHTPSAWVPNAVAVAEVPLAFGWSFLDDHLCLGGAVKVLYARVFGARFFLDDAVHLTGVAPTSDLLYSEPWIDELEFWTGTYRSSWRVGLDAGLQLRWAGFTLGVHGRNLNRPRFRGVNRWGYNLVFDELTRTPLALVWTRYPSGDVVLDPQVTAGLAWSRWGLTLTAEAELLRTESIMPGQYDQAIRGGVEWVIADVVALRAGIARNLALDEPTTEYSAGLGVKMGPVGLDLSATASRKRFTVDDTKVPWVMGAAFRLSAAW